MNKDIKIAKDLAAAHARNCVREILLGNLDRARNFAELSAEAYQFANDAQENEQSSLVREVV